MTDPDLRQQFLNGMSRAAATVNIVTTNGSAGRAGVTVSAMSSVSADARAPIMLVCLHHQGKSVPAILENGAFVVNVLREDQSYISDTFAGRRQTADGDAFSCTNWTEMSTGCPRIVDPLVAFDCKILDANKVGTHYVVMGEVQDIFLSPSGRPLIFANRSYGSAERILPFDVEQTRPENALRIGIHSSFGSQMLPQLIKNYKQASGNIEIDLYEGDQLRIAALLQSGDVDIALLYDAGISDQFQTHKLDSQRPFVLVSENHPLAKNSGLHLQELSDFSLILQDAPPLRDYILSLYSQLNLTPKIAFRPWYIHMAMAMAANELGYVLMTASKSSEYSQFNGGLVRLELLDDLPCLDVVMAFHDRGLPVVGKEFVELCLANCNT